MTDSDRARAARERAQALLRHYFSVAGVDVSNGVAGEEIDEIVRTIIEYAAMCDTLIAEMIGRRELKIREDFDKRIADLEEKHARDLRSVYNAIHAIDTGRGGRGLP